MSKKKLIITLVIITILSIVLIVVSIISSNKKEVSRSTPQAQIQAQQNLSRRSSDELIEFALSKKQSLKNDDGTANVKLAEEPQRLNNNWYILRLIPIDYENDTLKMLIYDEGGELQSMKIVLSGTYFPDEALANATPAIPAIVKSELNR